MMGEELGITASESDQLYVSLSSQHCVSLSQQCSPPPLHNMTVAQQNITSYTAALHYMKILLKVQILFSFSLDKKIW